jgi:hypothetical protein
VLSCCLDKHKLQILSIDLIPGRLLEVELDRSTSLDPICNTCSRSRFVEFRFRFVASYGRSMSSKSSTSSLLLHLTSHGKLPWSYQSLKTIRALIPIEEIEHKNIRTRRLAEKASSHNSQHCIHLNDTNI